MTSQPSVFDSVGWAAGRASGLKKTEWRGTGVVICLGQGAELHMAQLMPLPLSVSYSSKSRFVLSFWYWLTCVVPDKAIKCVCMCVGVGMGVGVGVSVCVTLMMAYNLTVVRSRPTMTIKQ